MRFILIEGKEPITLPPRLEPFRTGSVPPFRDFV